MEGVDSVRNGEISLAPGFRFIPTDEELVHYLKRKVVDCALVVSIIPDVADVFKYDPWSLPGDLKKEKYFFSKSKVRPERVTRSGYWKAIGVEQQIMDSRRNQLLGIKKTLQFHMGKPPNGPRTEWNMNEYYLVDSRNNPTQDMSDWVLCRIFLEKRSAKNDGEIVEPGEN